MSKNGKRLVGGVREMILVEGTTLEDLHMVATEVVVTLDKILARTVRKLKTGQQIRCYDETSNKEYGVKGSDVVCFYKGTYDTQTYGIKLKVYDLQTKKEWGISTDCLLEVYDKFDPDSPEGKKAAKTVPKPKRRGRKSKAQKLVQEEQFADTANEWNPASNDTYEKEIDGEEYIFNNLEEYQEFFDE